MPINLYCVAMLTFLLLPICAEAKYPYEVGVEVSKFKVDPWLESSSKYSDDEYNGELQFDVDLALRHQISKSFEMRYTLGISKESFNANYSDHVDDIYTQYIKGIYPEIIYSKHNCKYSYSAINLEASLAYYLTSWLAVSGGMSLGVPFSETIDDTKYIHYSNQKNSTTHSNPDSDSPFGIIYANIGCGWEFSKSVSLFTRYDYALNSYVEGIHTNKFVYGISWRF